MYYTYVIKNALNKIYTGQTDNLEKRLKRHNNLLPNKKSSFTHKNKGPWKLIYYEILLTRDEAISREKYLKSYMGRLFIKNTIGKLVDPPKADF